MAKNTFPNNSRWQLIVPGSSANVGPGFDSCGLALQQTNTFSFALAEPASGDYELKFSGKVSPSDEIKQPAKNHLIMAYEHACKQLGLAKNPVAVKSEINIPLSAGMGSSGTAAIAGCTIALLKQKTEQKNMPQDAGNLWNEIAPEVFQLASALEKHPDNVAPSIFGGFVICPARSAQTSAEYSLPIKTEVADKVKCYIVHPDIEVATPKSRQVLSGQVTRKDAVFNLSRTALLANAFATRQYDLLKEGMQDKLHEEQRDVLYDYRKLKAALLDADALGVALSGSGPSVLVLCYADAHPGLQKVVAEHFAGKTKEYDEFFIDVNNQGALLQQL